MGFDLDTVKSIYASKTFWGALVGIVPPVALFFGVVVAVGGRRLG